MAVLSRLLRPGTLYLRFDDDIVYFADDAVENLVRYRLAHREPFLILGNIVNNAVCTHFHQQAGLVPLRWGAFKMNVWTPMAGAGQDSPADSTSGFSPSFVRAIFRRWKQVALPIDGLRRFSINMISWFRADLCGVPELASDNIEEEPFLTEVLPARLGRPNEACSEALFALRFLYATACTGMDWSELAGHYQAIAERQPNVQPSGEAVLKLIRNAHLRTRRLGQRLWARRRQWRQRRKAA